MKNLTKWDYFERVVKIIECASLAGGVAVAFFIGYQWKEMRTASEEAEKAIELNRQQLKVMQGQLDEMRRDERAWVAPFDKGIGISDTESAYILFTVHFKNTGKTPALHVRSTIGITSSLDSVPQTDPQPNSPPLSGIIPPDQIANSPTLKILEQPFLKSSTCYVYGTVWYDDIFGNHHWTQFCDSVDTVDFRTFNPTANHNECDNN